MTPSVLPPSPYLSPGPNRYDLACRLGGGMRRREFLGVLGGLTAWWPLAARAQQKPMPVLGFLGSASPGPYAALVDAVRQGLKETGYVEGQNLIIEFRWADSDHDRLPALAAELVSRKVDVIVTSGSVPPALAAKAATSTIPIVFHMGGDPVTSGVVDSLNRPGGNITGVTFLTSASASKRLGLLRDLVPAANVIGLLHNRNDPTAIPVVKELETAVPALGLNLQIVSATNEREIDEAYATFSQRKVGALVVHTEPFFRTRTAQLVALASRYAIPAIYSGPDYARAGGLLGYGASVSEAYRQQGVYAGKILKGEKPANLPVMQSTKFEFVINLKTARALGIPVPSGLLSIADDVVE
jgi:putative ABC transport system substrate-binding protein